MQYSEGTIGRIFALKLETGERLPDAVVDFALEHAVRNAMVMFVGGAAQRAALSSARRKTGEMTLYR